MSGFDFGACYQGKDAMMEDAELLRRYAEDRAEAAFAELVGRRVDLVYAVARRQCGGDAHLAEEVTLRVFADLARKAKTLAGRTVISGWLYRSVHFAASDAVRAERRRRAREQEDFLMKEATTGPGGGRGGEESVETERLRPVLDAALGELREADRDAVALRFLEERPWAEVAVALGLKEDAARKRVARALDALQGLLAKRGITSTAVALSGALGGQAAVAAPTGLAASIAATAMIGATSAGGVATLAFFTMGKLQIGVAAVLVVAGLATVGVELRANRILRAEIGAIEAGGVNGNQLRAEKQQLAAALQKIETTQPEVAELGRLQTRLAQLKARPEGVVEGWIKNRGEWRNMGRATPLAALETGLWAAAAGDTEAFARGYIFPADTRAEMERFFARQSDVVRAKHVTPERLIGALWLETSKERVPVAYQFLEEKRSKDDETGGVTMEVWMRHASGSEQVGKVRLEQGPAGWAIPANAFTAAAWEHFAKLIDPLTGEVRAAGK